MIRFFFPIKKDELKQFLILGFLMFFIILNNTLVRSLKDTFLVMTNGALSIAFIKMWGVLPVTFITLFIYGKLSNSWNQEKIFNFFVCFFLLFFLIFGFFLLPNSEFIHFHALGDWLRKMLPSSFKEPIGLLEYWSYSLFYIVSELWSSIIVSLLFWQFVNSVVLKEQAKRFYPLFGQIADTGMIFGGIILVFFSEASRESLISFEEWKVKVQYFTILILISGLFIMAIYFHANRVFEKIRTTENLKTRQKTSLSFRESFSFISTSPNLRYLGLMVLGFAIANNLIEIAWKSQLKVFCQGEAHFAELMGYFSIFTGISTILLVFLCGHFLRTKGWIFGALAPPLFMLFIGTCFFGILVLQHQTSLFDTLGYSGALLVPIIGSLQNIVGKAMKFSLFDPTKEMAFIPLDVESRTKGKAAIDLLGVRTGKSIGSFFHQTIAVLFGSFEAALGLYLAFFFLILAIWISSTKKLYEEFIRSYAF